jgi:hypothetical protein
MGFSRKSKATGPTCFAKHKIVDAIRRQAREVAFGSQLAFLRPAMERLPEAEAVQRAGDQST